MTVGKAGPQEGAGRFLPHKASGCLVSTGEILKELGRGLEGRMFDEAVHELARLVFVFTVVIFHMVFNHIVITKHQDHFLPSASPYRVLGCGGAKMFVQM